MGVGHRKPIQTLQEKLSSFRLKYKYLVLFTTKLDYASQIYNFSG